MKHELILDKTGGFPFDQQTLEFMQLNTKDVALGLASVFGPYVILSGVAVSGPNYTDGWVLYNGELLPFSGGTVQTKIKVVEVIGTAEFEDAGVKEIEKTRICQLSASEGVNVSSFTRMGALADLYKQEQRDNLMYKTGCVLHIKLSAAIIPTLFDIGTGVGTAEPYLGWAIDSDSMDRFILGWGAFSGEADGTVIGGAERVTLSLGELPAHNHANGSYNQLMKLGTNTSDAIGLDATAGEPDLLDTETIASVGGGESHENMPPYVVYLNIVKL